MEQCFEWDADKDERNIEKHGISFFDAIKLFEKGYFTYPSPRGNEERIVGVGKMQDKIIAIVYMIRGKNIRIISARMARNKEKALYSKWSQIQQEQ